MSDYTVSLTLHPSSRAYNNRGVLLLRKRQYGEALSDFDHALVLDRKNAASYHGRAMALSSLGDAHGAAESFRKGCEAGFSPSCTALRRLELP